MQNKAEKLIITTLFALISLCLSSLTVADPRDFPSGKRPGQHHESQCSHGGKHAHSRDKHCSKRDRHEHNRYQHEHRHYRVDYAYPRHYHTYHPVRHHRENTRIIIPFGEIGKLIILTTDVARHRH